MSLKSEPYYWLECDGCGAKSTECGEYGAYSDPSGAQDDAEGNDWSERDGKDYCADCPVPWCRECERDITPDNPRCDPDGKDTWGCAGCCDGKCGYEHAEVTP